MTVISKTFVPHAARTRAVSYVKDRHTDGTKCVFTHNHRTPRKIEDIKMLVNLLKVRMKSGLLTKK